MLSEHQILSLSHTGFLHIPHVLIPQELQNLRNVIENFMTNPAQQPEEIKQDFKYGGVLSGDFGKGNQLSKIQYMFHKHSSFLILLAHPQILNVISSIYPSPVIVTYEDLVIKMPHSGFSVPFHQDVLYQGTKVSTFTIGIYLDDSGEDPILFLPGSHQLGTLSSGQIKMLLEERKDEIVRIPVQAGDLLVHHALIVHGSQENVSKQLRRVLYFDFRTAEQVRNDSPWDESWLQKRLHLIPSAIKLRRESDIFNHDDQTLWKDLYRRQSEWLLQPPLLEGELPVRVRYDDVATQAT